VIRAAGNDPRMSVGLRQLLFLAAAVLFAIQAFGRNDSDVDFLAAGLALMAVAFALGGGGGRKLF
jgi:hypothetical protein